MAKLDFKDYLAVDNMPGEDGLIKKNAKKRKMDTPTGNTGESVEPKTEALDMAARRKRSINMKRIRSRLAVGRKRQAAKMADQGRLNKRAMKAARAAIAKRMTKGVPKTELTPARKQEIEKKLDKMQGKIKALAKRLMPKIRKAEIAKHRGKSEDK